MNARDRLQRFFLPKNIAVIGASAKSHWFGNLVRYCRLVGFKGTIYPVNPGAAEVCGIPALPSIDKLPERSEEHTSDSSHESTSRMPSSA